MNDPSAAPDDLEPPVITTQNGSILEVTLNRPKVHNALTLAMWDSLAERITRASTDDSIRGAVIMGAGPSFCAGGDLPEMASVLRTQEAIQAFRTTIANTFGAIAAAPYPVVAAIHGAAIGGGAEVALACTMRCASPDARLAMPGTQLGLALNQREIERVKELIGPARAADWILSGRTVLADEALQWGLIDRISSSPLEIARQLVNDIAGGSYRVTRWTKNVLEAGEPIDQSLIKDADQHMHRTGTRALQTHLNSRPAN